MLLFADEKTAVAFEKYLKSGSGARIHQTALFLAVSNNVFLAKICRTPPGLRRTKSFFKRMLTTNS